MVRWIVIYINPNKWTYIGLETPRKDYQFDCLRTTVKHDGGYVMIWGAISHRGFWPLVILNGSATRDDYFSILAKYPTKVQLYLDHWIEVATWRTLIHYRVVHKPVLIHSTAVNEGVIILEDWSFIRELSLHRWVKMTGCFC